MLGRCLSHWIITSPHYVKTMSNGAILEGQLQLRLKSCPGDELTEGIID